MRGFSLCLRNVVLRCCQCARRGLTEIGSVVIKVCAVCRMTKYLLK